MEKYAWLKTIGLLPRTITYGLALLGTNEVKGSGSNDVIESWRDELNAKYPNLVQGFSDDSVPWCGLFVAIVVERAGKVPIKNPLWARNWGNFGSPSIPPSLGDVLVFVRDGGGHVGFYIAEDDDCYHVLGGNQSDSVTITRIEKRRCIAVRQPPMQIPPASRKPYFVEPSGQISTNEA
jgi:uncharacterized protein (TIGR02594 family)